jgi:hypothetical protein
MAISFVGAVTGGNTSGVALSLSLTALAGGSASVAASDDIVIVVHGEGQFTSDQALALTTAGYTSLADLYHSTSKALQLGAFLKRMGPTPDALVDIPANGGAEDHCAIVYVLRGVDTTTALDASVTTNTGNNFISDNPSVTTVTNGAVVLAIGGNTASGFTTPTAPAGYSNLSAISPSGNISVFMAMKTVATAGVEDPAQWANVGSGGVGGGGSCGGAITVALRPAAASTGGKIKHYNGSTWAEKPVKVYNGTTWVTKPVKVFNGTSWVLA